MPFAEIDGISTHYEVVGEGPPLLMFSPGGFDARIEKWSDLGVYKRIRLLDHLPRHFTCILFDRRENGGRAGGSNASPGSTTSRQGAGLLDHLGHESAHLMGGCMGCCPVAAFAARRPAPGALDGALLAGGRCATTGSAATGASPGTSPSSRRTGCRRSSTSSAATTRTSRPIRAAARGASRSATRTSSQPPMPRSTCRTTC